MSINIIMGALSAFAGILMLKAVSANVLYALLILLSVGVMYGTLVLLDSSKETKFKRPTGKSLYVILISSVIIGLIGGLITIRLLYI